MAKKKPYSEHVKFLHFRAYDTETAVSSLGGATVAYVEGETGITYAIAWCHELDRYVKEFGRIKSAGRLLSERLSEAVVGVTRDEFIAGIDSEMAQHYLFRTRRAR